MKLYEVPNNTEVRLLEEPRIPPGAPPVSNGDTILFFHVDGMYSYCKNSNGDIVHIAAWTEVEIVTK